jgi:hypothetical protein
LSLNPISNPKPVYSHSFSLKYSKLEHISADFTTVPELLLRFIEQAAQAVTAGFGTREVPAWNLAWGTNYPD